MCALTAALLYTMGVLLLKRSTVYQPGPWRTTLLCNFIAAIVFAPMWFWGDGIPDWRLLWQPAVVAVWFIAGQATVVLAVTQGDVSLATPLLSLKILFVAGLLTTFAGAEVSPWVWPAGVLAIIAIACLSYQGGGGYARSDRPSTVPRTIMLSVAAALAYAIFDCMIQVWAPTFSAATFLPLVMVISAALSLGMWPKLEGGVADINRSAWPWMIGGGLLTGLQSVFLTFAIGTWGHAAAANVVYSSRGLWSVIAVATIGYAFSKQEYAAPTSVKRMRLVGAALMTLAIALMLI